MMRAYAVAALAAALGIPSANAQLAARVAAAPDGEVRMTFAARSKACGDGKDVVAIGKAITIHSSMESYGRWSGVTCVPGPARVAVTVRDHRVSDIRSYVGGSWSSSDNSVTDLGRVPARDAATYFLSLAPAFTESSRNPILAAALADSSDIAPELFRLARLASLPRETRRRAMHWVGVVGGAPMVGPLVEFIRGSDERGRGSADDVGPGNGERGVAVCALSMLENGVGIDALIELARRGDSDQRKAAVFWLGQTEHSRGRVVVRAIAADANESEELRGAAIFALGQGESASETDAAFLRDMFQRLPTERLKDRLLMVLSQMNEPENLRWMLAQARDEQQPVEVRKKVVFWAGQGNAPIADLVSLYFAAKEPRLREHLIFVLSQRPERAATDAMLRIARFDDDKKMRSKALFWLAQRNDPTVTKYIADLVTQ